VDCWLVDLLRSGVDCLSSGEDVESEVAAAFGPFVVLLGEDGSDEADDAGAVGEAFFLTTAPLAGSVHFIPRTGDESQRQF
jgi:hypothetical protein